MARLPSLHEVNSLSEPEQIGPNTFFVKITPKAVQHFRGWNGASKRVPYERVLATVTHNKISFQWLTSPENPYFTIGDFEAAVVERIRNRIK